MSVIAVNAQSFSSYFSGDTSDVTTNTRGVTVLMGGATENDSAMIWFLQHSGGGDILVLRTTGADGYNDFMYSQLGVTVNSVETIVCNNASASSDPYVIQQLINAEALWFAGGDQWTYVSYWKNTPIDSVINYLINVKKIPIGGTSAGMAILGHIVNTAQNGSAVPATVLANPYDANVTLIKDSFIFNPWLNNVVTDTHYDNPDRRGRQFTFLARIMQDYNVPAVYGIACNEYVAVCIDTNGLARVYGDYPNYQEFAYFLQANCVQPNTPEICLPSQPLNWNRNAQAVKVYKVPGTLNGANSFQLNNWNTGSGGSWQDWFVDNGALQTNTTATAPGCSSTSSVTKLSENINSVIIFPDPANDVLNISITNKCSIEVYDMYSKLILKNENCTTSQLDVSNLIKGCYIAVITEGNQISHTRFIKN